MNTLLHTIPHTLPPASPQETLSAFRKAYLPDEVQEELWRCLRPRLVAALKELDTESANKLAELHGSLEVLVAAVYRLPEQVLHAPVPFAGTPGPNGRKCRG